MRNLRAFVIAAIPFSWAAYAQSAENPVPITQYDVLLAVSERIENGSKGALSVFKTDIESMQRVNTKAVTIIAKVDAGFNMSQKDIEELIKTNDEKSSFSAFLTQALKDHGPAYKGKVIKSDRLKAHLQLENGRWKAKEMTSVAQNP